MFLLLYLIMAGSMNVHAQKARNPKLGIPIIWYHTDAHPDYHLPGDETQKIN